MNRHTLKIATSVAVVAIAIVVGSATPRAYTTYSKWTSGTAIVYISPANHDGLSADAVITALGAAMDDWTTQGHSPFTFTYGGRVTDTTFGNDNRNVVLFRNESNGGMIAAMYSWTDGSNRLLDSDIVIYDAAGYYFYAFDGSCNATLGNGVYLHDLATHEFGHMLGLQHSSDPSATMAPGYATCSTTPRTLESDDIAGIQALYGTSSSTPPTNTAPVVSITQPSNNSSNAYGASITFSGSATDTQDGSLASTLKWTSNLDGQIGTGGSFSRTLSTGTHVITATVTDAGGLVASSQVSLAVGAAPPSGPTLTARGYKVKALQTVDLKWSGFSSASGSVDIYRAGAKVSTALSASGAYTDNINKKGTGSFSYQVCAAGTATVICTNLVSVTF